MISSINDFQKPFFIGIAGTGMSAIAQYLQGIGKQVSGSDRYFHPGQPNETKEKLKAEGILCFLQNGEGINNETDLVVVSTAVEDTVEEVIKARNSTFPSSSVRNCWPLLRGVKRQLPWAVPVAKAPPVP